MSDKYLSEIKNKRLVFAWVLFFLWVSGMTTLMWNSFHADFKPFLSSPYQIDPEVSFPTDEKLTFLHFIDEACQCSRFSRPHIREVEEAYERASHLHVKAHQMDTAKGNPVSRLVVSSPSVAIFSEQGRLVYYGPYTDGALCGQGRDLLSQVMEAFSKDQAFQWLNLLGSGCFCEWPTAQRILI